MKRKGISPLIAAVLLIAFTLAVAAILTAWVTTFTQNTTGTISNRSGQLISCSYAGLSIYDVVYNTNTEQITVSVANTGTKDLSNVTVVVFSDTGLTRSGSIAGIQTGSVQTKQINVTGLSGTPSRVRVASTQCSRTTDEETEFT
ncbi:MAG: archaellin/type IV pilin N-terminal domain-containing protein, partial [Candidatus Nanohaloarchaea archaeon]|nr:archaellin/type IV pilin N-terminal domain-containing protein [Candidatus Nanohaloarchaea archaeon]